MSKPISVGDVVQIVKWPHEHRGHNLGRIATVTGLSNGVATCEHCGWDSRKGPRASLDMGGFTPLAWLKRIPPLDELEGEKRDEKLTEPA